MEFNITGRLSNYKVQRETVDAGLTSIFEIKTSVSANENILSSLKEYHLDINNMIPIDPDWDTIEIPLKNWDLKCQMKFDCYDIMNIKFESVKIKCKETKDGSSLKDYTFKVSKEAGVEDYNFNECYLQKKHEVESENEENTRKKPKKAKFEYSIFNINFNEKEVSNAEI